MSLNHAFQSNISLQSLTTFGIAATARYYLCVTEVEQLHQLKDIPEFSDLPILILGGGSNLVLTGDFSGIVLHIQLAGRERVSEDERFVYVRAAAGELWHDFVTWTLDQGWGGLENLSLIPGSVGAAPIQNIGAYGVEIKDRFHSLRWFEFATGKIYTFSLADCEFAYRDSVFKNKLRDRGVILDVTFALAKEWQPILNYGDVAEHAYEAGTTTPKQISTAICKIREGKLPDPKMLGNAGSFFKNPLVSTKEHNSLVMRFPQMVSYPLTDGNYKLAAAWLIEKAGWKGYISGRVGVYQKQALVLVNLGGAIGAEVIALAKKIQEDVKLKFGVQLEIEPILV